MKNNEFKNADVLEHIDPQRRQFMAKLIAGGAALPVMSSIALAQPGAGKGKGGQSGKGKGGAAGKGKGGFAGKGKGGFGTPNPDPAEFAAKLMKDFDKDGDKALNLEELTAALKSVSESRGMQGGAGKGKGGFAGKGKGEGGFSGKGKGAGGGAGKGKGNDSTQPSGSVKPKRPSSE